MKIIIWWLQYVYSVGNSFFGDARLDLNKAFLNIFSQKFLK